MNFFIYANSSQKLGLGHVMRQNVLASELLDRGYAVTFVYSAKSDEQHPTRIHSAADYIYVESICLLKPLETPSMLIIDDYELSEPQWLHCIEVADKVIFFDDEVGRPKLKVDLAINMSGSGSNGSQSKLYIAGSKYRLIRREFRKFRDVNYAHSRNLENAIVTVMLGANDAKALLPSVCECLTAVKRIKKIKVLTTLDKSALKKQLLQKKIPLEKIEILSKAANLAQEMKCCNFAVCAAGGALYEYLLLGVPTIALIVADNQQSALSFPKSEQSFVALDFRNAFDSNAFIENINTFLNQNVLLDRLSMLAKSSIDGLGAQRIVTFIENHVLN
ncbi:hypothetical protein L3V43_15620 [Pseudoalteromonas sp. L23]|uniref:hypothetical protein n=1 Tax=unclassified Pseudoalteromonas TaxID=194690 RepID=UPI001EF15D0F|nr:MULTISPECIES: hypothetical protein [unclassified Pseudoalteromonas]MCF7515004.1 hypothetical protein [Pseudoalteromonas sp. L7]MCF7527072.1 hypothetical protein [Pseudoalteromonas sp. L23]MCX2767480.1 hypothetical protein [Pseudoalteromonas sp. B530]